MRKPVTAEKTMMAMAMRMHMCMRMFDCARCGSSFAV